MAKTPLMALRLDPEIRRALDEICEINGITLSDAVRLALLDWIAAVNADKNKTDAP